MQECAVSASNACLGCRTGTMLRAPAADTVLPRRSLLDALRFLVQMAIEYDFIVIGGSSIASNALIVTEIDYPSAGPSGCVVASRLAHTSSKPSVLLLEAGGTNDTISDLSASERFNVAFSPNSPLNWNYKTTPQTQLDGQTIDYSRGKGLGGSTAINFCGWTVGSRDDNDEWARLVGDDSFGWENARRCLDKIETLHPEIPDPDLRKYVNPDLEGTVESLQIATAEN